MFQLQSEATYMNNTKNINILLGEIYWGATVKLSTFVDDTYSLATVCFLLHMSTAQIFPEEKSMLKRI